MSRLLPLLMIATVAAVACTSPAAAPAGQTAVATVYPLAWIVGEVAPDLAVTSFAAGGQDPHDLELSPGQRADVERASLVVYLGDIGFQPQVESAITEADGAVVSAAGAVGENALLRTADGDEIDPHLWFDVSLLLEVAQAVADGAAEAHPDRAAQYRANAEQLVTRLQTLTADVDRLLARCRHDQVVVGHEAFAYLLRGHGLEQRGISGAGAHAAASPRDIADLSAVVRAQGLPAVLSEPVEGRSDAEAVAREAGVDVIEISSLDIVTQEQAAKGFPQLLLEQAQAVAKVAECGSATL